MNAMTRKTVRVDLSQSELQTLRDALAELRSSRHGQLTLEVEASICAVQNRLRQLVVR